TERPSNTCASTRYGALSTGRLPHVGVSDVRTHVSPMWWHHTPPLPFFREIWRFAGNCGRAESGAGGTASPLGTARNRLLGKRTGAKLARNSRSRLRVF